MKIVLTGSSSHLAQALLPKLCAHQSITQIIGIDIKPCSFQHEKFSPQIIDIRDKAITNIISQSNAVIHTAFVVLRSNLGKFRKDRELARDINVNGSLNVFQAALQNNLDCLIHISSASVYGALEGKPEKISESHQREIMPGFSYAEDKNAVEDWLDANEIKTTTRIIRFRPHVILGPHAQAFLLQLIRQPFYPYFKNPQPQIQCSWEEDVVDAIIKALFSRAQGVFNIASQPATSFKQIIQSTHRISFPIPFSLAKTIQNTAWKFSAQLEEPGWIDGMKYSLVLDTSKIERELNWRASKTSLQCALDTLA